jgi:hypothetical protein
MVRKCRLAVFASLLLLFLASRASAGTYYVSTSGSDSNSGTSQSSPWAHIPGMATWTGNYTPAAGDTIILRGCDVWTNANFPIVWTWSGSSGSVITVGVDQTWYNTSTCASAWNRPVFNAGGTAIQPPECTGGNQNKFLIFNGATYVTVNSIEMTGFYWNSDQYNSCWSTAAFVTANNSDYITLNNFYIHNWSVGSSATDGDHLIAVGSSSPWCDNCLLTNSVIDGSASNKNSGVGVQWSTTNTVIHNVTNAFKPITHGVWANNNVYAVNLSFDGESHPNCFESTGSLSSNHDFYIYNNRIHDNYVCEGLQVGNPNEIDYVWNNIWYNNTSVGANGPQVPQSETPDSFYFWNNTVVGWTSCVQSAGHGFSWTGSFVAENNLCIDLAGATILGSPSASTTTINNNIGISAAVALTQGLTNTETYVYAPVSSNCNGITSSCLNGAGANLTSLATGLLTALQQDTTYGCVQGTVSGVVQAVCNQRTAVTRPTSGAWDVGAYQYSSSTSTSPTAPNPPTGLTAIVQ